MFLGRTAGLYPSRPSSPGSKKKDEDPSPAQQRVWINQLVDSPSAAKIAKFGRPIVRELALSLKGVLKALVTRRAPWRTVLQVDRYFRRMFVLLGILLRHLRRGGVVAVFSSETDVGGFLVRQPELVVAAMKLLKYKLEKQEIIKSDGKKKKELLLFKRM